MHRLAWFTSDKMKRRQCDNAPFGCFASDKTTVQQRTIRGASRVTRQKGDNDICCDVAINNTTRNVYQISHHSQLKNDVINFQ
jgi:hypothetical protein